MTHHHTLPLEPLAERLRSTLGSELWLRLHEKELREALPKEWTALKAGDGREVAMKAAWNLKLVGIDWRTTDEFGRIMVFLEKLGILQRQNGYQVRGNPSSIFPR